MQIQIQIHAKKGKNTSVQLKTCNIDAFLKSKKTWCHHHHHHHDNDDDSLKRKRTWRLCASTGAALWTGGGNISTGRFNGEHRQLDHHDV